MVRFFRQSLLGQQKYEVPEIDGNKMQRGVKQHRAMCHLEIERELLYSIDLISAYSLSEQQGTI